MSVLDQANALAAAGRGRDAVALVERAAAAGDAEALFAVANWRLFGLNGPRDPAAAHPLLARAAAAGSIEAARLSASLVANGTGVAADPHAARERLAGLAAAGDGTAAREVALLDAMPTPEAAAALPRQMLSADPPVLTIAGLVSPAECEHLIGLAAPRLGPSHIVDAPGGPRAPHPFRTSDGMNFGPTLETAVVRALNARFATVSGTKIACGEPLQILRYRPGQRYRPHLDAMPGVGNQRDWTLLVLLRRPLAGGETRFPALDLSVLGAPGDALLFRNVTTAGETEPRARHSGEPVSRGEKWIASRWIRRRPFDAWADR